MSRCSSPLCSPASGRTPPCSVVVDWSESNGPPVFYLARRSTRRRRCWSARSSKPSLGLSPAEVAATAKQLAAGGADLIKDDELLGDPPWCPLDERVAAVAAVLPDARPLCGERDRPGRHAARAGGPRRRAGCGCGDGERVRAGPRFSPCAARSRARRADLRPPRRRGAVGAGGTIGVAPDVIAELTRLCRRRLRPGRLVHRERLRHAGGSARTDRRVSRVAGTARRSSRCSAEASGLTTPRSKSMRLREPVPV